MSRLPSWGYREFTKFLGEHGCAFYRESYGDHEIWWDPKKKLFTSVDRTKTYPVGTLKAMLRDLQIDEQEIRFPDRAIRRPNKPKETDRDWDR